MTDKSMRRGLTLAVAGVLGFALALPAAQAETLTVYTAVEAEDLKKYAARFNDDHPDIEIQWIRDSTGVITAKLLAEKDNPQADVIWGLAATSLLLFKGEGMLEPYAPKGLDALDDKMKDKSSPPSWVGMDAWVAALCVNTIELEKNKLPMPASWADLTKPVYKGHIIMPNPNSSGTGFLDVSSWLQMMGETGGWKFMDALHENISRYTHSGSAPCKLAAAGETTIGVSFAFRGAKEMTKGAPVKVVIPSEGVGWDMEAAAIVKDSKKMAAATKTLMDWAISEKANVMYNEGYAVIGIQSLAKPVENFPPELVAKMIDNDFEFAANNRSRILGEWQNRYDSKSDPKN